MKDSCTRPQALVCHVPDFWLSEFYQRILLKMTFGLDRQILVFLFHGF
jgi:hypothetical protein